MRIGEKMHYFLRKTKISQKFIKPTQKKFGKILMNTCPIYVQRSKNDPTLKNTEDNTILS
jgi:hypothetical protein